MSKKKLILIPALLLALTSCGPTSAPTDAPTSAETPTTVTPTETPSVTVSKVEITNKEALVETWYIGDADRNVNYTITYSDGSTKARGATVTSSNPEVIATPGGAKINAKSKGTATVTVTVDGVSDSVEITVSERNIISISDALKAEDDTVVLVEGIVKFIDTQWSDSYKNMCVTITDETLATLYLYRLGTKVEVGDLIRVEGKMATYNGSRQVAQGATAEILSSGNEVPGAVEAVETTITEALTMEDGTLVKLSGIVRSIDTPWSESYGNISVTIIDESLDTLYLYRLSTNVEVGDEIEVEGLIGSHNGKKQLVSGVAKILSSDNEIPGGSEVYVPYTISQALGMEDGAAVIVTGIVKSIDTEWSDSFNNMSVTIIDETLAELYIYRLSTKVAVGDKIEVTGKMATYNDVRQIGQGGTAKILSSGNEVPGSGSTDPETPEALTILEALAAADGTEVTVLGVVKEINTAYSEEHGNISLTITDPSTLELYCYRLTGNYKVGDEIKVTGKMATYKGSRQIGQGATAELISEGNEIPTAMTITEALAAADDEEVLVKGIVKKINTAYSEDYGNISLTITDETYAELYCYRLKGNFNVGDEILVAGTMDTYNGSRQVAQGAEALVLSTGNDVPTEPTAELPSAETEAGTYTKELAIADYAAVNKWENSKLYESITIGNITVTTSGTAGSYGLNTGKYYESGDGTWRVYQNETPSVTFAAADGANITIDSITVTYAVKNGGVLTLNGTNVESKAATAINAATATFGVGNTGDATNGNIQISAISVTYTIA